MVRQSSPLLSRQKPTIGFRVWVLLTAVLCAVSTLPATPALFQTASSLRPPDKSYGVSSAPIKMEVYSDYQCPYCRAFYDQTLTQVIRYYVPSGKVYLVHHDFPMPMHKYSGEAARWANACAEVGQFEAAETALYDNQDAWGSNGDIAKYIAASMPASDFKRVEAIMKQGAMPAPQAHFPSADPMTGIAHPCPVDPYIVQDIQLGYKISAPGTPSFVVTYKGHTFAPVYVAVSWPVLKQLFDTLLQQ
ncbi:MAG TPA: thioredoxin domain-containing protein [Candidatus Acidoferrales bacterium]|nr:thioredoxin domain-containing protein [Candidatus Acidoferrales bacterium]